MNMERLRDYYNRFRQWQERPYEHKLNSDQVQHCNNCGCDFTGNFCPVCSQKAGLGRVGWRSVRQGIMDIWGLGTRSLLYSVWQLLWRPGHLIGDYIDGKRQVSFPPVKMLFIIAVVYSMIFYWFFPDVLGINITEMEFSDNKEVQAVADNITAKMKENYSWFSMLMAVLAVLPTWIMFRFSPRRSLHTLPEGFFIQVFLSVVMLVLGFLLFPLGFISPEVYTFTCAIFYGIYYIVVYKYLFGYGLWGTLWRCGFIYVIVVALLGAILYYAFVDSSALGQMADSTAEQQIESIRLMIVVSSLLVVSMALSVGFVINYIVTRKSRRQIKQAASSKTISY